ncbi:sensor histidine kinase [Belnapia moabensis]|uniref:sensor histidine kinase n=1 Tax=Belnapia moabensis TaxID=365533 RepID=UPI0005B76FBF|nr:histidine kinase dimerization/phosphoacceptor domain -containing protein [Belnapia moabensis]
MRILIADDDPDFRGLASRAMRREFEGAAITEIGDRAGLDAALAAPQGPDLLISDLSLNWIDGFSIFDEVRRAWPGCVAIMFTGTGDEEVAVRAIKAGFDDYVVKSPKQLRRLAAAARAALTRVETRRGLEENRDLLTQELYHRLHNNLQLVVGLIAFTARSIDEPVARRRLDDLGRRVQSLSLLQERLYRGGDFRRVDFPAFLGQLTEDLIALDGRGVATRRTLEPRMLPVDIAVPLALIANELITNALKHAVAGAEPLVIGVAFRSEADGAPVLEVADNGSGQQNSEAGSGLGGRLVQRLAQQIGGVVEVGSKDGGGRICRITVRNLARPG